jgi:hypothetical protein
MEWSSKHGAWGMEKKKRDFLTLCAMRYAVQLLITMPE